MNRFLRTLLVSAVALAALATAATAATPPGPWAAVGMASMHATATTGVTADPAGHEAMHAAMQADCPASADGSMASMHRDGGHDMSTHHRAAGGDRS